MQKKPDNLEIYQNAFVSRFRSAAGLCHPGSCRYGDLFAWSDSKDHLETERALAPPASHFTTALWLFLGRENMMANCSLNVCQELY